MTKRLTEKQKEEIVKSFKYGEAIDVLSEKYSCTIPTIIRNLKKNLGDSKYKEFLNTSKSLKRKSINNKIYTNDEFKKNCNDADLDENPNDLIQSDENLTASNFATDDYFLEIAPIDIEIDNSSRKDLSSVHISDVDLPKVVYMIVDKKIELEIKLLKDFPEWDFLSHDDLNRKTIEIFFDLNIAKRSCKKEQKVLKVPNTDVFRIAARFLVGKGISRIVCSEKLIAL